MLSVKQAFDFIENNLSEMGAVTASNVTEVLSAALDLSSHLAHQENTEDGFYIGDGFKLEMSPEDFRLMVQYQLIEPIKDELTELQMLSIILNENWVSKHTPELLKELITLEAIKEANQVKFH